MVKRPIGILCAAIALLVVVGCTDGGSTAKKPVATTTTSAAAHGGGKNSAPVGPPSTGGIDREPMPRGTGIIKTTSMDSCDVDPGGVTASGTVELPAGMEPTTAVISVSWVNAETATVFARSRVEVDARAGEKTPWQVANLLPDNGVPVRCVVGAVVPDP